MMDTLINGVPLFDWFFMAGVLFVIYGLWKYFDRRQRFVDDTTSARQPDRRGRLGR